MGIKETIKTMQSLIEKINNDLKKSQRGNKAASQRVRTSSIKLAKVAKTYRKESVIEEKRMKKKKGTKKVKRASKRRKTKSKSIRKRR